MEPTSPPLPAGRRLAAGIALTAIGYAVTGRLGLLLAIPPGYATAVWLPSGIALAALLVGGPRLWPGAFLGSFAVNCAASFDGSARSLAVAAAIAAGASLQALLGAGLVRPRAGPVVELVRPRDIAAFFLLGGPVSCLVNATIGVGTLFLAGLIGPSQLSFSWWTWWIGDSIGVAVAGPLVLVALGSPREIWRRRLSTVALPSAVALVLVIVLFVWVSAIERGRIAAAFRAHAQRVTASIAGRFGEAIGAVGSVADLVESRPPDRASFRAFCAGQLARHPGVRALSWNPVVPVRDRESLEARARRDGLPAFRVTERDEGGRLVPATPRERYVVVLYIEPYETNTPASGYDVSSEPARAEALRRAAEEARPVATTVLRLVQAPDEFNGILVFLPLYATPTPPDTPEARRTAVRGFATGVFQLDRLFGAALAEFEESDVVVSAVDDADGRLLWRSGAPTPPADAFSRSLESRTHVRFAGRPWTIACSASAAYLASARSWRPWIALAGGMLLVGLLQSFFLAVSGAAVTIGRLGAERAAELRRANDVLSREVLERRQAEAALARKDSELRQAQKMDAIGRLAGGVAHDFNNLLTVIIGYGDLLAARLEPASVLRAHVEEMLRAGRRASDLTRQLLAFSRKQVLQPRVLDLNRVIAGMDGLLRRLVPESIELRFELEEPLGPIRADPGQIEQVVLNLAANARDAMPHGGRLTLRTASTRGLSGERVTLEVADTGVGMDEETQAHLFEPFFTTKGPGRGTGLGLSTVYGIVAQSGGEIDVRSRPGEGATFRLSFPLAAGGVEPPPAPPAPAPGGGRETILVVEDEPALRRLSTSVLLQAGYRVLEAGDGAEGLAVASAHPGPIDLVVTDVVMPRMGGRELVQHLVAKRPGLKALFVSGYSESAVRTHGRLAAESELLEKPFEVGQLLARVRAMLDRSRSV